MEPTTKGVNMGTRRINHHNRTHCACGAELQSSREAVTVSGWYGDYHFQWDNGICRCVDAQCARCRYRTHWTPVEVSPGVWEVDVGLDASGLVVSHRFTTMADAWEYLRGLALVEMSDAGVRA